MPVRRIFINTALVLGLLLAAYLLYKVFSRYSLDEIIQSIAAISASRLMLGVGFCALSYLCLSGFDWMALRYAGKPLSYPKAALASFASLSIGHNLGVAALSSGAVRYRYYARWGLNAEEVAKVVLFCGVTVGIGLSTLAGILLLINPGDASNLLFIGADALFWLGVGCLAVPVVYIVLAGTLRAPLLVWRWYFEMPALKLAIGQVIIGTVNFICVAACLHQMLGQRGFELRSNGDGLCACKYRRARNSCSRWPWRAGGNGRSCAAGYGLDRGARRVPGGLLLAAPLDRAHGLCGKRIDHS